MTVPLPVIRFGAVVAVVAGLVLGFSLGSHVHKVLASILFGVIIGLLWRLAFGQAKARSPELLKEAQRNAAEAQKILRESTYWRAKLGDEAPWERSASPLSLEETISDWVAIALAVCLAVFVWFAPEFFEPTAGDAAAMAKSIAAHAFALLFVATATLGMAFRLSAKR